MTYSKLLLAATGLAWIVASVAMPAETSASNLQTPWTVAREKQQHQVDQRQIAEKQEHAPRYTPPPNRGTPHSNKTTGSRDNCFYHSARPPLAALVGQSHLSWTLSDRPTIWIYSPDSASETLQAELILQTEATDEELYRGTFPLDKSPGVQGAQLPSSMTRLEVGKTYRWYIDVLCKDANHAFANRSANFTTITGVIERVSASAELEQGLEGLASEDAIALYGQNHLWYDMLTQLARQRLDNPNNLSFQQHWLDLLQDQANVGLDFVSREPLIGEVTVDIEISKVNQPVVDGR